jgi:hypothetical protein
MAHSALKPRYSLGVGRFCELACRDRNERRFPRQTRAAGSGGRVTLLGFIELATLRQ